MTMRIRLIRPSIFKTQIGYHAQKNKQKYSEKPRRQFHTTPPTPPDKPIELMLALAAGFYIFQHNRGEPPCSPSAAGSFGLY
jgi:hypothetical protein